MNIEKENALDQIDDRKFNQLMKYSLIDYTVNLMGITTVPTNDGRTMCVEYIVPMVKYFNNITGLMSFAW